MCRSLLGAVLTGNGGQRSQPFVDHSGESTSDSSVSIIDTTADERVIPLAARSAAGLAELAKILIEVSMHLHTNSNAPLSDHGQV